MKQGKTLFDVTDPAAEAGGDARPPTPTCAKRGPPMAETIAKIASEQDED